MYLAGRCAVVLTAIFVTASGAGAAPAQGPLSRWAIIASKGAQDAGFADLFTAEISAIKGIELVERERLAAATRELELSTLLGASSAGGRLKLGRTVGAQGLLLLSMQRGQAGVALRLDFCDCRYGVRLRSELMPYAPDRREQLVKAGIASFVEVRQRFESGVQRIVCAPNFISRNLTHDYDALQGGYGQLLRDGLTRIPGVAVVEIDEARAIGREVSFAGAELATVAPIIINGEFRVAMTDAREPAVNFKLVVAGGGEDRTITRNGVAMDKAAELLGEQLPAELLKISKALRNPATRQQQIDAMAARAQSFASLGALDQAAPLREAILVWEPGNADQRIRLMGERSRPQYFCELRRLHGPAPIPFVIPDWTEANTTAARVPFFTSHTEYLIRNRLVNPCEAVNMIERVIAEAYLPVEAAAVYGVVLEHPSPFIGSVGAELAQSTEDWFWQMAPLIFKLDSRAGDGRDRDLLFRPFQQVPMEQRSGFRPMPADAQEALAVYKLALLSMKLGVVGVKNTRVNKLPDAVKSGRVSELEYRDAGRLQRTAEFLERFAPAEARVHPRLPALLSVAQRPMGQWAFPHRRFSAGDSRQFSQALVQSKKPWLAFLGRYGLACLDAQSEDRQVLEKLTTELDWLAENYARQVMPAASLAPGDRDLDRAYASGLEAMKRLGQSVLERLNPVQTRLARSQGGPDVPGVPEGIPILSSRVVSEPLGFDVPAGIRRWINCDGRFDLLECGGSVYGMFAPGKPQLLAKAEQRGMFCHGDWDGKYIWVLFGDAQKAEINLFDAKGDRVLRTVKDENPSLPMHIPEAEYHIAPGRTIVSDVASDDRRSRRRWFGLRQVKEEQGKLLVDTRIFHEATELAAEATGNTLDDPRLAFKIAWMAEVRFPQTQGKRLLFVGRQLLAEKRANEKPKRPLVIDLETLQVSLFEHAFPGFGSATAEYRFINNLFVVTTVSGGAFWRVPADPSQPWKPVLSNNMRPYRDAVVIGDYLYNIDFRSRLNLKTLAVESMGEIPPFFYEKDGTPEMNPACCGSSAFYGPVTWNFTWPGPGRMTSHPVRVYIDDPKAPSPDFSHLVWSVPQAQREQQIRAMKTLWAGGAFCRVGPTSFGPGPAETLSTVVFFKQWKGRPEDFASLAKLYRLGGLHFAGSPPELIEQALKHVPADNEIRQMTIRDVAVSDAQLKGLATLTGLWDLIIFNTGATDESLKAIAKMAALRHLWLADASGKRMTHAGLASARDLPKLASVILAGPGFTDEVIEHLKTLPSLYGALLYDAPHSVKALRELRQANQGVRVIPEP